MHVLTLHYAPLDVCLGVRESRAPAITVVSVTGDVDETALPAFAHGLDSGIDEAARSVIVDLTRVDFLGLSGLQALAVAKMRADCNRVDLLLVPGGRCVLRPLVVSGLLDRFSRFRSVQAAVDSILAAPGSRAG
ncbi:STAS domain-containing protein [Rhodococcus sp. NPDC003318]|uniref:STAS domain-containing protein n=1 Tax=Rhodococcus sp. NPDC003318 TaxID=3364503 RepID=UPI0036A93C87